METVRNKNYPQNKKSLIVLLQEYAWDAYLVLFMILMMIIFLLLIKNQGLFWTGILGVFGVVIFSNIFAAIRMKKILVEIGFKEGHFFLKSLYDVASKDKAEFFPLPYANAKLTGEGMSVTYFDQIILLRKEEWGDQWEELLYYFGFIHYGTSQT